MKASHGDSGWDCHLTMLFQPNRWGNSTVCPRLEIGNSSVTPWRAPRTIAWKVVIKLLASASTRRQASDSPNSTLSPVACLTSAGQTADLLGRLEGELLGLGQPGVLSPGGGRVREGDRALLEADRVAVDAVRG